MKNLLVATICSSICFALGYGCSQYNFQKNLVETNHAEYNSKSGDWQLKTYYPKANEVTEIFAPLFPSK